MQTSVLDVTVGFEGDVLGPVRFEDAVTRVLAFCTAPHSGWLTYDLAGHHARAGGAFETVTPWSLLWADALAGQVSVRNVADFTQERRRRFASLLAEVPDEDLHRLDDDERERVAALCGFGFPGVWGPKITKVAALYRPRAVPVLDGYVAMAFGFARDGFTEGVQTRHERIRQVLAALASWLGDNGDVTAELRARARLHVPEIDLVSDLRLLDIVLWTSQDDRLVRARKPGDAWLRSGVGDRIPLDHVGPVEIPDAGANGPDGLIRDAEDAG